MSTLASAPTPGPDLSIRARSPSPRRLSRKVLLAGAIAAASVVTLALFYGLSERPRRNAAEAEAVAAAGGPPESIRNASSQYEASDLPQALLDPPQDIVWGDHPPPERADLAPPQEASWRGGGANPGAASATPDPQSVARASPIIFSGRDQARAASREDDGRLDAQLVPPRSRYELISGSVIPAALVTALNSDLPGSIIAQVTSNVYDSVSGQYLLIPQGARLIGEYRSAPTYGDRRLLLVWNRLIFPNGWSISLRGMQGTDPSGASGLRDQTDNHLGRLAGAVGLSAVVSVVADNAQNDDEHSLGQSVGDAAAAEAARTGGRIIDRELQVRPTLRVRAGASVRVLVTRDIQLRPYRM
ncbi:MAG TPA: TrbI/VirB10 family protein [Caulobacterales bacterium]|nr:TrbI/VirB10 family protein [Caulobacterales bacterium]